MEGVTKLRRVQLGARDEWEHKLGTREISLVIPLRVARCSRPLLFPWCRLQQVALVVLDAPAVTLKRRKTLKEQELRSRVARA